MKVIKNKKLGTYDVGSLHKVVEGAGMIVGQTARIIEVGYSVDGREVYKYVYPSLTDSREWRRSAKAFIYQTVPVDEINEDESD